MIKFRKRRPENMPNTKAQKQAIKRYVNRNYDLFQVSMKKGLKDKILKTIEKTGDSINGYIIKAIENQLKTDGIAAAEEEESEKTSFLRY